MRVRRLAVVVTLIALGSACKEGQPPERDGRGNGNSNGQLVMLNVFCTLGTDLLGPYNQSVGFTPNLDRLAREGVVFERHTTEAGQSGIAFASIMTGEQAMRHLVYSHPTRLRDAIRTLPEAFAEAGWDTYFWEDQNMATVSLNYGQGSAHAFHKRRLLANDPHFAAILRHLKTDPNYKALVVSFYSLTHSPYSPRGLLKFCWKYPDECKGINPLRSWPLYIDGRALTYNFPEAIKRWNLEGDDLNKFVDAVELIYKSRVSRTDEFFGDVVKEIESAGLLTDTLIAFTADHGETLYRDNSLFKWSHSFDLAPDVINVPLIIKGRGVKPGRYVGVSGSADLFPTIAGLAGVPVGEGAATFGKDLSKHVLEGTPPPGRVVFSHTGLWPPLSKFDGITQPHLLRYHPRYSPEDVWVSARAGDLVVKYRHDGDGEFIYEAFDLASDPSEGHNVFDPEDPHQSNLVERLIRYRRSLIDAHVDPRDAQAPQSSASDEDKMVEQLRALGYID